MLLNIFKSFIFVISNIILNPISCTEIRIIRRLNIRWCFAISYRFDFYKLNTLSYSGNLHFLLFVTSMGIYDSRYFVINKCALFIIGQWVYQTVCMKIFTRFIFLSSLTTAIIAQVCGSRRHFLIAFNDIVIYKQTFNIYLLFCFILFFLHYLLDLSVYNFLYW